MLQAKTASEQSKEVDTKLSNENEKITNEKKVEDFDPAHNNTIEKNNDYSKSNKSLNLKKSLDVKLTNLKDTTKLKDTIKNDHSDTDSDIEVISRDDIDAEIRENTKFQEFKVID